MKIYYLVFVDDFGGLHYRKGPLRLEEAFQAKAECWDQEKFKVVAEIKQVEIVE